MKFESISNAIFATVFGVLGCVALVYWCLTCNVVNA